MSDTFARLYGATAFDPDDRQDQIGEAARQSVLDAVLEAGFAVEDSKDMAYLLGGLLVGVVQVMQATSAPAPGTTRDQIDAAIRASIMQMAPWAVDMARSAEGKEPLANA